MAHRLEHSVDAAMAPNALDELRARVDEMGRQIAHALASRPRPLSLEPLELQINEISVKLDQAEGEFAKIGAIEGALHRLIERVDAQAGQLSDVAAKAATEAARLVSNAAKLDAATAERLDAMHRDLKAMNARSSAAGDHLAGIIESVHASLKQLVEQTERGAARAALSAAHAALTEATATEVEEPGESESATIAEPIAEQRAPQSSSAGSSRRTLGPPPPFGRAKRALSGDTDRDRSVAKPDLDMPAVTRSLARTVPRTQSEMEEDLVAAARRAAQAAARRAAERTGGDRRQWPARAQIATLAETDPPDIIPPFRRGWPLLAVSAAVLLVLSALLLYSRLQTKPWPDLWSPAVEDSASQPPIPGQVDPLPDAGKKALPPAAPRHQPAPAPPASPVTPDAASDAAHDAAGGARDAENVSDIAKSSYWPATVVTESVESAPAAAVEESSQAASADVQDQAEPALPPGVVFTIEDPAQSF
jgi:hypothetical protein